MRSSTLGTQALVVLLALAVAAPVAAAPPLEWTSLFGGAEEEFGESVSQLPDGGYLVGGSYLEQPVSGVRRSHTELYLARTDGAGGLLWSGTFCEASDYDCFAGRAVEAGDGGFLLLGTAYRYWNHFQRRIVLFKVDADGNEEWVRSYGWPDGGPVTWGNAAIDIRRTPDGQFVILGTASYFNPPPLLLLKIDADGNELWKTAVGDPDCFGESLLVAGDGGLVVAGYCPVERGSEVFYDAYLLRTDGSGNVEWSTTWGGNGDEYGMGVCPSGDGGYVMSGYVYPADGSPSEALAVRFDGAGQVVWESSFGGGGDDWGLGVAPAADGGFVVTGGRRMENYPAVIGEHLFVVKVDASGRKRWEMLLGEPLPWSGTPYGEGDAVVPTADGGFVVAGAHRAVHDGALSQGGHDVYLAKFGPEAASREVAIDIKPGTSANRINLRKEGVVTVAILGSADFAAAAVDPATVTLAGAPVRANHLPGVLRDANHDGLVDLVLAVDASELDLDAGSTEALLTGLTRSGEAFWGRDAVAIIHGPEHGRRCTAGRGGRPPLPDPDPVR